MGGLSCLGDDRAGPRARPAASFNAHGWPDALHTGLGTDPCHFLGDRGEPRLSGGDDARACLVRLFVSNDRPNVIGIVERLDLLDRVLHTELVITVDRQLGLAERTQVAAGGVDSRGGIAGSVTAGEGLGPLQGGARPLPRTSRAPRPIVSARSVTSSAPSRAWPAVLRARSTALFSWSRATSSAR